MTGRGFASGHAALALGICFTAVYVLSAIVSFAVTSSPGAGREKLTLVLVGLLLPLALVVILQRRVETQLGVLGLFLGLTAPVLGIGSLFTPAANREAIVGSLALLIPLAGCGLVWAMARENQRLQAVLWACLGIAVAVVIFSGEHSAILGLVVGSALGFGFFWRFRIAQPSPWLQLLDVSTLILIVLMTGVYLLLIIFPAQAGRLGNLLPLYYAQRFAAWREMPAIIHDYLFTGSGLGAAPMVLSSYLFLVHVPYFYHVHNLFLQVGIEQGLPGIIGITGMFLAAFWSLATAIRRSHPYLALCAAAVAASLISLFVYGLLESDVYASAGVIIMFLPFGFAWVIAERDVSEFAVRKRLPTRLHAREIAVGAIPIVLVLALIGWPGSPAQWLANRGALAQTWEELSDYVANESPSQDELRRHGDVDLDEAVAFYRQALAQRPFNATALRRLAQIQIGIGEYDAALRNLERAYQVAPGERATRQMLGEMYAWAGRLDEATTLWRSIQVAPELLQNRLWWYNFIGDQQTADNISLVLQRLDLQ